MNPIDKQPEPLRAWYKNKTRNAIRGLIGASVITIVGAVLLWVLAEMPFLARMQTFNGAIIIPAFGGIWIASFMFIWLIPMRELSFRGQESFDRSEEKLKTAIDKILPAVEVWQRIGERVEKELLPKIEKTLEDARQRVGPAAESVRRLENSVEGHVGLLAKDVKEATQSIKRFFGPQGEPPDPAAAADFMGQQPSNGKQHVGQGASR